MLLGITSHERMTMSTEFSEQTVFAVSVDQVHCTVEDEIVLLNLTDGTFCGVNTVGARVWNRLQAGPCTFRDLLDAILAEYEVAPDRAENDLRAFLTNLLERNLATAGS